MKASIPLLLIASQSIGLSDSFSDFALREVTPLKVVEKELRSHFVYLSSQGASVRVPKGSVLVIPEAQSAKVFETPQGRLVGWAEFLRSNPSWLTVQIVSWGQVKGETPLPEKSLAEGRKMSRVVVGVFNNNPISVKKSAEMVVKK